MTIRLVIPGEPKGKQRPRFNRKMGVAYTPSQTASAEGLVQHYWDQAGQPKLTGPVAAKVEAVMSRPKGHYRTNGDLNATGLRTPFPMRAPDLDNIYKLAIDALNRLAFHDDAHIVSEATWKRWCRPGETPCLIVELWSLRTALEAVAA